MSERKSYNFHLMYLAENYDLPEGWEIMQYQRENHGTECELFLYTGAVCPKITSGKYRLFG